MQGALGCPIFGEAILRIEADIQREQESLASLQSGEMRIGQRKEGEPWGDVTETLITRHKRATATFKATIEILKNARATTPGP